MATRLVSNSASGVLDDRVRAALEGAFDAAQLSDAERDRFEQHLGAAMDGTRTAQARAFWAGFQGQASTDE